MDALDIRKCLERTEWCSYAQAVSMICELVTPEEAMARYRSKFANRKDCANLSPEDQRFVGRSDIAKSRLAALVKAGQFEKRTGVDGDEIKLKPLVLRRRSQYGLSNVHLRLLLKDWKWHDMDEIVGHIRQYVNRPLLTRWQLRRQGKPLNGSLTDEAFDEAIAQYITVRPLSEFRRCGEVDEDERDGKVYVRLKKVKSAGRR